MTILFYGLAIACMLFGTLYTNSRKKKLPDELILEFEKTIKPKLVRLILLQILPLLFVCFYVLDATNGFRLNLLIWAGIAILILSTIGYFFGQKILNRSENRIHFMYSLNLFIFNGLTNLLVLAGVLYGLKDYLIY